MAWKDYENMALEYHAETDRLLKIRNALKKKKDIKQPPSELLGSMITSCYNSERELDQIAKILRRQKHE